MWYLIFHVGASLKVFQIKLSAGVNFAAAAGSLFITCSQDGPMWPPVSQQPREHMELLALKFFHPNSFLSFSWVSRVLC